MNCPNLRLTALVLAMACMLVAVTESAEASLIGDTIEWQYYRGGGPETTDIGGGSFIAGTGTSDEKFFFTIYATDSQIVIDYHTAALSGTGWVNDPTVSYDVDGLIITNGMLITDWDSEFLDVALDPSSNMDGLAMAYNAHNIALDWNALPWDTNTQVILNVSSRNSVPEPATMLLFSSGLAGLLAGRKMVGRK